MSIFKISIRQIKAARSLLDWSQERLAEASGVSLPTVRRLEAVDGGLGGREDTAAKIVAALEGEGIEFTNSKRPGVRLKSFRLKDGGQTAFPLDNPLFFGFGAVDVDQRILVRVEALALERLNPSIRGGADYIQTLEAHRGRILRIAQAKYERGIIDPDHSVSVRYDDITQLV